MNKNPPHLAVRRALARQGATNFHFLIGGKDVNPTAFWHDSKNRTSIAECFSLVKQRMYTRLHSGQFQKTPGSIDLRRSPACTDVPISRGLSWAWLCDLSLHFSPGLYFGQTSDRRSLCVIKCDVDPNCILTKWRGLDLNQRHLGVHQG